MLCECQCSMKKKTAPSSNLQNVNFERRQHHYGKLYLQEKTMFSLKQGSIKKKLRKEIEDRSELAYYRVVFQDRRVNSLER